MTVTKDLIDPYKGSKSLKMYVDDTYVNSNEDHVYQDTVLYPGRLYRIAGRYKTNGRAAAGIGTPNVAAAYFLGTATAWTSFSVVYAHPATDYGNNQVKLSMIQVAGPGEFIVWFDAVTVTELNALAVTDNVTSFSGPNSMLMLGKNWLTDGDMEGAGLQDFLIAANGSNNVFPSNRFLIDPAAYPFYWAESTGNPSGTVAPVSIGFGQYALDFNNANHVAFPEVATRIHTYGGQYYEFTGFYRFIGFTAGDSFFIRTKTIGGVPSADLYNFLAVDGSQHSFTVEVNIPFGSELEIGYRKVPASLTIQHVRLQNCHLYEKRWAPHTDTDGVLLEKTGEEVANLPLRGIKTLEVTDNYCHNGSLRTNNPAATTPANWTDVGLLVPSKISANPDRPGMNLVEITADPAATPSYIWSSCLKAQAGKTGLHLTYLVSGWVEWYPSSSHPLDVMVGGVVQFTSGTVGWKYFEFIYDPATMPGNLQIGWPGVVTSGYATISDVQVRPMYYFNSDAQMNLHDETQWPMDGPGTRVKMDGGSGQKFLRVTRGASTEAWVKNPTTIPQVVSYTINVRYRTKSDTDQIILGIGDRSIGIPNWNFGYLSGSTEWTEDSLDIDLTTPPAITYLYAAIFNSVDATAYADFDIIEIGLRDVKSNSFSPTEGLYPYLFINAGMANLYDRLHVQGSVRSDGFCVPVLKDDTGRELWRGVKDSSLRQPFSVSYDRQSETALALSHEGHGSVWYENVFFDADRDALDQRPGAQTIIDMDTDKLLMFASGAAKGDGVSKPQIKFGDLVAWTAQTATDWEIFTVQLPAVPLWDFDPEKMIRLSQDTPYGFVNYDDLYMGQADDDTSKWHLVFFVGGPAVKDSEGRLLSIETAFIPEERIDLLKQLILRNKPLITWCGMKVLPG
jgi:hypothetical protein